MLHLELPEPASYATVDPRRIEQVVVNLLSNAQKFTPSDGRIDLRLSAFETSAQIEVCDTGIGVPREELERIFQKFYQVDGSITRRAAGNGLGLSICRAIVEEGHAGKIWAERNQDAGTTFYIRLPLESVGASTPSNSAALQAT